MSNCIGSYGRSKSILLGVYKGSQLTYCIEIGDGVIRQFKAKYNKEGDRIDRQAIEAVLKEKDIINQDYHQRQYVDCPF